MKNEILTVLKLDKNDFQKGFTDAEKSVLKISGTIAGFGAAALAAAKVTADFQDATIKLSRQAGVTSKAFSEMQLAADMSGVSSEMLAKSLSKLNNPSTQAQAAMKALGVSMKDATGKTKDTDKIFSDISEGIKKLESPAQRSAYAVALFGEEGGKMVSLLKDGSDGLNDMAIKAKAMGLVVTQEAGEAAEKFNDDLSILGKTIQGVTYQTGQAVIAFVNESGIINTLSSVIQDAIVYYDSLDKETRQLIEGSVMAAAGIAAVTLAVVAAGAAIIALSALLTPLTITLGLIAAAAAVVAYNIIKYWSQIKPAVDPLKKSFDDLKNSFRDTFKTFSDITRDIKDTISGISGIGKNADESGESVSILGTISSIVFKSMATAVSVTMTSFKLLLNTTNNFTKVMSALVKSVMAFFSGDFSGAKSGLKKAFDEATNMVTQFQQDILDQREAVSKIWSGDLLVKNIKESVEKSKKELEKLNKDAPKLKIGVDDSEFKRFLASGTAEIKKTVEDIKKAWENSFEGGKKLSLDEQVTNIGKGMTSIASQATDMANVVLQSMTQAAEIAVRNIQKQQNALNFFLSAYTIQQEKQMQQELETLQAQEDEKLRILENAKNERLLLLDNEYQEAKRKREEEFQSFLESERIKFEAEKAFQQSRLEDREANAANEAALNEDWDSYAEILLQNHQDNLASLQDDFNQRKTNSEKMSNEQIAAAQIAAQQKIADKQEQNEKRKQENAKKGALLRWQLEVAQFEATKQVQALQTQVNGIASAAQAFGSLTGSLGIVGAVIGAGLAAQIISVSSTAAAQIRSAPPPLPPAELLAAEGGVFMGPSHSQGGIKNVTMEGGEGVLSAQRTQDLMNVTDAIIDMGQNGSKPANITINVYASPGMDVNELADAVSRKIADATRSNLSRSYAV